MPRRPVLAMALLLAGVTKPGEGTATPSEARPRAPGWADGFEEVAADLRRGKPLVVFVVVPLCDNAQIDCGSGIAGRPRDLAHNVYWGAVFGQRRFFERKRSGWTRVELSAGKDELLERAVYRRTVPGAAWNGGDAAEVEQIVVLQAVDGAAIDHAVERFFRLASEGGRVQWKDGERVRDERIHVVGYAGHNRLMDGQRLPALGSLKEARRPIPSFVMACDSDPYFSASLRRAGSEPLVMTRSLMAPEGYVIDAIAGALGENAPRAELRARAVAAYAKWQQISTAAASSIFAR